MNREQYARQVRLLVSVLPHVAAEDVFALKGGTAINLFYRAMPRLSVDIDLVYLPAKERAEALQGIDEALDRIAERIRKALPKASVDRISGGGGNETRILVREGATNVKIETSPVGRGTVHPVQLMSLNPTVEEEFGFAEIAVVSFEDLYGGKMHAALDRQHPRDLYDIGLLYENEGMSDELFRTFLVYAASSPRPLHELLSPQPKDIAETFEKEFVGMTADAVSLGSLEESRTRLIADVKKRLTAPVREFLLSLHEGEPDFDIIGLPHAKSLPAVAWKVINLKKLKEENVEKHTAQRAEIEALFGD